MDCWTCKGVARDRPHKKPAAILADDKRHFRRAVTEFVDHDHWERNHQGLEHALIAGTPAIDTAGRVRRRLRLGGLLNYDERAA
jgi:hypothetical protein